MEESIPGIFELGTDGPSVILVGVDGTDTSLRAAAYAIGLARRQGARLMAVYVGPIGGLAAQTAAGVSALGETADEMADDLRQRLGRVSAELGVSVEFMAVRGDAVAEISRVAGDIRADAVVVGASTKAGHRLVGSVAVRLVRAGRWPVTVVP
ncbi:MAG: universal stress protein [Mycobacteriales bacterium]